MSGLWLGSYLLLWAVVAIQGVIIIALLRVFAGLHQQFEDQQVAQSPVRLAPGVALVDRDLTDLSRRQMKLSQLWQNGNLLLLFASVNCVGCRSLLAWVGEAFRNGQLADCDVCVLCAGNETAVQALISGTGLPPEIPVIPVEHASLQRQYYVYGTPTLAVVDENGNVLDVKEGEVEPYLSILARRSEFRVPV